MIKPENLLLLDIETVPMQARYELLSEKMQALWAKKSSYLDVNTLDVADTFAQRGGIYAEFGKIVCIGLGYFTKVQNRYLLKIKSIAHHDEKVILHEFKNVCEKFFKSPIKQFCGHNIKEFDIPYICRRSIINQIHLPNILLDLQNKKPWENPMLDTLQFWKFGEYKNFTSVDLLATILEIESPKEDINGSDVARVYWEENNLERIVKYCSKDIVTVAQILMRLNGMELLQEEQIKNMNE